MTELENTVIHNVQTLDEVNEFKRWLGQEREFLAYDTETGGLEFYKQPLRLVQIGDTNTAWVFRADRWLGVIEETLPVYGRPIVGQNIGFDQRFMEVQGKIKIPWSNLHDTKIMAHIINPNRSTSLKSLGSSFLSPQAKRLQGSLQAAMAKQKWGWNDIPIDFPLYIGYAGVDTILTARIAEKFYPQIQAEYQELYNMEMEVARICSNMEIKGVQIDVPYCEQKYDEIIEYCKKTEEWCIKEYDVRPSETQKVASKLVKLGVDLTKTTTTGLWSMDKDVLEGLDHPLAQAVLGHRKATKIVSTYFGNFLSMHDGAVLHPSINTLGARTGRMSIQNPALQTLPRGSVVRDAFIPRNDCGWVSADFDAIEMRLLAHFCQDSGMIEAIRGGDIHTEMAKIAYNDENIDKKDFRRQTMKNANFAKSYVSGVEKFSATAGISVEEGKAFLDMYDERFPGVKIFQRKIENVAKQRFSSEGIGYVKSPMGRKHTSADKEKFYTLVNYLIQGTASEVFKKSLIDLDKAGFGDYMLLPVHDEQDFEIPQEQVPDMMKEIESIMTQNDWTVPLTVSTDGPFSRWGDKGR